MVKNMPAVRENWFYSWVWKIPWEGNGNPFQYSCLENSMDRGAWWATIHGVVKSWTWLSDFHTLIVIILHYMIILLSNYNLTYSHNQASLVAQTVKHLPAMQETRVQSLVREDPLEKEMATHSSILAWQTPWTEEPDGLQSMGSQRAGRNWAAYMN